MHAQVTKAPKLFSQHPINIFYRNQACGSVARKIGPPYFRSPLSNNIEIFGSPGTKMFERIGPPLKYFIPLQNLPEHYFHACIKRAQIFHLK